MTRSLRSWALIALLLVACWPWGARAPVAPVHALVVDTTVLIVRIFNYQPSVVTAYLDRVGARDGRIGDVPPMHEAFFVLPSVGIVGLTEFIVTVISADSATKPYHTGSISRNPWKITMVYVMVGERSPIGPPQGGRWRSS